MDTERAPEAPTTPPGQGAGLQVGSVAPAFEARSTQGVVRLADFRGRWVLFFSHPADFTPVCTSEFVAIQRRLAAFEACGCALLGLSVDSLYAHLAWIRDIEARFGERITFPILEDISMAIARAYGMVAPDAGSTAAVRSVFFIDPDGIIRAVIHYPASVGRSVDELLRVLRALQTAHDHAVNTPEGWQPGEETLLPPPADQSEADRRAARHDGNWYFTPYTEDDS
jgi:peroxiredoxin (alkyl hydroperoxide reductase subunit C)